jgi:hypothetical protein
MLTSKFLQTIKPNRQLSQWVVYWVVLVGLSGCEHWWGSNLVLGRLGSTPITVAQLQQSDKLPRRVKIVGRVSAVAPMLDRGAYRLEDDTGVIWVYTEQPLPSLGEKLAVKGELNFESVAIESIEAGQYFLVEYERDLVNESSQSKSKKQNSVAQKSVNLTLLTIHFFSGNFD